MTLCSWEVDPKCKLCSSSNEDMYHLFFTSPYSAYLWTICWLKLKLNVDGSLQLHEEIQEIYNSFKTKNQIRVHACACLVTMIYQIWQERYLREKANKEYSKIQRAKFIQMDIDYLMTKSKTKTNRISDNKEILERWGIELNDGGWLWQRNWGEMARNGSSRVSFY